MEKKIISTERHTKAAQVKTLKSKGRTVRNSQQDLREKQKEEVEIAYAEALADFQKAIEAHQEEIIAYQKKTKKEGETYNLVPGNIIAKSTVLRKDEWISSQLDEWDEQQIKIPTGRYKDSLKIKSLYQQRFTGYLIDSRPGIVEELKDFVPYFKNLFAQPLGDCVSVFAEIKFNLQPILLAFREDLFDNEFQPLDKDFQWGDFFPLLYFIEVDFIKSNHPELAENFRDFIKVSENHSRSIEQAKTIIIQRFTDISPNAEKHVFDFAYLMASLIHWAEKHNLNKDWLINYAIYFIFQFAFKDAQTVNDLKVHPLNATSLPTADFTLEARGWIPNAEDKEEYEIGIIEYLKEKLAEYFDGNFHYLGLDKQTKTRTEAGTNHKRKDKDDKILEALPPFTSLKILIAWNEGATHGQLAKDFGQSARNIKTILTDLLKNYNLPKIKRGPGGRQSDISDGRVREIKNLKNRTEYYS